MPKRINDIVVFLFINITDLLYLKTKPIRNRRNKKTHINVFQR